MAYNSCVKSAVPDLVMKFAHYDGDEGGAFVTHVVDALKREEWCDYDCLNFRQEHQHWSQGPPLHTCIRG